MLAPPAQSSGTVSGQPPSDEGSSDEKVRLLSLEKRLNRLVQRILDGLCVPFLGAGISVSSPASADAPTINAVKIAANLAQRLFQRLPPASATAYSLQKLREFGRGCAKLDDAGQPIPDENDQWKRPLTPSLGEVAELCWSVLTPSGTCEVLRLERWSERKPTAAHHYLAMLVREGLITEVLETNYDEFVEQAVRETFGEGAEVNDGCAPVISDLESYRRHIASARDIRRQQALVKVVKLNGCAAAYRREMLCVNGRSDEVEKTARREAAARRIVLTEEQLQSWGDKHWARELLNDRVRSRTLLFVGFGNADPIVRHHSVQVIREFQAHAAFAHQYQVEPENAEQGLAWYAHNNAPFVAAYEKNLSFYQYQVLRAFRDAHIAPGLLAMQSGSPEEGEHQPRLEHVASVYENTFLGADGKLLVPLAQRHGTAESLPADRFLEVVAARCLCRLVPEKWFGPESPLHSYLQGALRHPRTLLSEICQVLFSGDINRPALFSEWLRLRNDSSLEQASSPWSSASYAIRGQRPGRAGYRPFLESPIKQTMLIVLMALVAARDELGRLQMPSGKDVLARSEPALEAGLQKERLAAYRLVDAEPEKGRRAVFATAHVDAFLYGDPRSPKASDQEELLPDHAVVIGLGRGNIGAFRRQVWFERPVPMVGSNSDLHGSTVQSMSVVEAVAGQVREASVAESTPKIRVVREVYVVGDLAVIRGNGGRAVELPQAHDHLRMLARFPETFLETGDDWRSRYCQEAV